MVTDLTAGLEGIGFRVVRQRPIVEPLLFLDTQDGVIFARGGRLARCRERGGLRWRCGDRHAPWIEARSLAELRAALPWLPGEAELHPVLYALRTGSTLRLRGLATRDLTLVVEAWSFSGPFATADDHGSAAPATGAGPSTANGVARAPAPSTALPPNGAPAVLPPSTGGPARPAGGLDPLANVPLAAPVEAALLPSRWYVVTDEGPSHDRAYLNAVLAEHVAVLGCERGRPPPRWDALTTGLELLGRLPPGLPAPRTLRLRRADGLGTVLSKVVRLQGLRLASCLDGVRYDRHPEYVHDARVATRRARFALRVAAHHGERQAMALRDELSTLARLLGPVRDLDVLIPRLGALAQAARPDLQGAAPPPGVPDRAQWYLTDALRRRRAELLAPLPELLQRPAIARLPELLSGWAAAGVVAAPVDAVAATQVRAALARATRAGRAVTGPNAARISDLHRLRLRLKRLRYTAELFANALPRRRANRALAAVVERCAAAQTRLGELNDDAVAAAEIRAVLPLLEARGAARGPGGPAALAHGVLKVLDRRQHQAARSLQRRWRRLRQRLEEAVAELRA